MCATVINRNRGTRLARSTPFEGEEEHQRESGTILQMYWDKASKADRSDTCCHHSDTTGNAIRCNTGQSREEKTAQIWEFCKQLQYPATPNFSLTRRGALVRLQHCPH